MSSSDSKYCRERIIESGSECGQVIPLTNEMCDACFGSRAAAYTAYGALLDNRAAEQQRSILAANKAASSRHGGQRPRNTREILRTRASSQALEKDPRPSSYRKLTNRDKKSSEEYMSQASAQTQAPIGHYSGSSNDRQRTRTLPYLLPYPPNYPVTSQNPSVVPDTAKTTGTISNFYQGGDPKVRNYGFNKKSSKN